MRIPSLILFVLSCLVSTSHAEVAVIYNSRSDDSKEVAEHYAEQRNIPSENVIGLRMSRTETIDRKEFRSQIETPIYDALTERKLLTFGAISKEHPLANGKEGQQEVTEASIRYLVLCHGVPLRISKDSGHTDKVPNQLMDIFDNRNEAAVDSELSVLPLIHIEHALDGPLRNPFYAFTNATALNPTNGILMVARLDGPTPEISKRLVDDAIEAEKNGLWGNAYFDLRNIQKPEYKMGDQWIAQGAEVCRLNGFDITLDQKPDLFPKGFPLTDAAYYLGWYSGSPEGALADDISFRKGAFAYHLFSFSASTLRDAKRSWAPSLLANGAAATIGNVYEPYLGGTPHLGLFTERFILRRYSFGEAAYVSQQGLSWQATVVGDPLYRPFALPLESQMFKLMKEKNPNLEWALIKAANHSLQSGAEPAEPVDFLLSHDISKRSALIQEKIAAIYLLGGKFTESAEYFGRALGLNRDNKRRFRMMFGRSTALAASGKKAEAIRQLEELISSYPDNPQTSHARAQLHQLQSQPK